MLLELLLDALCSISRMGVAYAASLVLAVYCGRILAMNARARAVLMPVLDILQSLPVLAFMPAAVALIVKLGEGRVLAIESAVVFLLVTCMAWNLIFGVYQALIALPPSLAEGVASTGCSPWLRFKRLELPACVPTLLAQSMMSWAGGWYFLVACEIFTVGDREVRVRGLGTFIAEAMQERIVGQMLLGFLTLVGVILLMDLLVWTPLSVWAERFRPESEAPPHSLALNLWRRFHLPRRIALTLSRTERDWGRRASQAAKGAARLLPGLPAFLNVLAGFLFLAGMTGALWWGIRSLSGPWPAEAARIPLALGASFLRLLLAYLFCLAWTVPVVLWIAESPRAARVVLPAAQILSAIPATAIMPFIVLAVVHVFHSVTLSAVVLAATGMQWYLFYSLVGGLQALPRDLKDAVRSQGLSRWQSFRRLMLPVLLPSLITGSLAGWGGAWNALVLTEFFQVKGGTYEVLGIGSLLDRASLAGDQALLVLGLTAMILLIVVLNRLVWQRAYAEASTRYALER